MTRYPRRARHAADADPAGPAPTTATSQLTVIKDLEHSGRWIDSQNQKSQSGQRSRVGEVLLHLFETLICTAPDLVFPARRNVFGIRIPVDSRPIDIRHLNRVAEIVKLDTRKKE